VDAVVLSVENIFPDNFTRREIMQCKAKCPFTKDGCTVSLCVSELERHVHSTHSSASATNGHGLGSENKLAPAAQGHTLSSGMVQCIYKDVGCASLFPLSQTEKHLETDVHHHLQVGHFFVFTNPHMLSSNMYHFVATCLTVVLSEIIRA